MTVIGVLSSFRELGEMSPHKRACVRQCMSVWDFPRASRDFAVLASRAADA
jgi:hypothetical protein